MLSFFTFAVNDDKYRHYYVEIEADNSSIARDRMVKAFDTKWAMQYTEKEFEGQAERWGYKKLTHITKVSYPFNIRRDTKRIKI